MRHKFLISVVFIFHAAICAAVDLPQVKFLDENETKKEIVNDSLAPYFNQLQPMEMSAKTGSQITGATLEEMQTECRKRYQNAARSFTYDEQEVIKWMISRIYPVMKKEYPKFADTPWSFLKVADNIEGGLPHTRGHHIILSESFCRRLPAAVNNMNFLELLIHEQFHVFQRLNQGFFNSLYLKIWGFEKAEKINGCDWLISHHLANPDALDCTWIFPVKNGKDISYILPLIVFSDGESLKKMPRDFRMIGISLEKSADGFSVKPQPEQAGKPLSKDLMSIKEYTDIYQNLTTDIYHPEEASADIFAKMIIFDYLYSTGKISKENYEKTDPIISKLRSWFKDHTKKE